MQADGKILVGGSFDTLGGYIRYKIGRLNADGTVDTSFNPGADGTVNSMALQPDGKILVGGYFTTLGGQTRKAIGRLNPDGTLDSGFNPGFEGVDPYTDVNCLAVQVDGKILVAGHFTTLGGQTRANLGRLNADGTLDAAFDPKADNNPYSYVYCMALQADGKVVVGGSFNTLGGQNRWNIGRLNNTEPATQDLTFDGATLTWMRGGTSPEVWRTTFEYSADGYSWKTLGAGLRIPVGWQLTGLALPTNTTFRGRGFAVGGSHDGSGWFVETSTGSPAIEAQPAGLTNNAATAATLSVYAIGSGPLSFQWRKDGANLADEGNVSGGATATLTLSNVLGGDAGGYSVVIANAAGSVTSLVATLTVIDPVINVQPASQLANAGDSATLSVAATGTSPLRYQWRKEGVIQAGATQSSLTLTNLQALDAGIYDVVVSNSWGSATSMVAFLSVNLALPDLFNPGTDGQVSCLAVQTDGKVLVGGQFTVLGGQSRNAIGRLNSDGTLDADFDPGPSLPSSRFGSYDVYSMEVQPDGKILVGSGFNSFFGAGGYIDRFNADGTLDEGFNPWAGGLVFCMALETDGRILVGGLGLEKLNTDGTPDSSFNPNAENGGDFPWIRCLALQTDGKILVGGSFTTLDGQSCTNIGRLNADGTLDTSFSPTEGFGPDCLAVRADGKILVAGWLIMRDGQGVYGIGQLNTDGTLDPSFSYEQTDNSVSSLALQADGKIVVGGGFSTLGGENSLGIGRLNADGTPDTSFDPGTDNSVSALALQADGKILVWGSFGTLGGQSRTNIGRLNNTGRATQSLGFDGSTLTWLRGGTSPEVWRTTFESSPDGASWTKLGAGVRIPGGWQLTGLALPTNTNFRARGYTVGGSGNGSGWLVETIFGSLALVIDGSPASLTNNAGTTAVFDVYAVGNGPLSYQWRKDGTNLADGGTVSGATAATLTLSNVLGGDAGKYSVVITNATGSVTSLVATLTVIDPVINVQPASQVGNLGDRTTLSVVATGTAPLSYQWRRDGVTLPGATDCSLTLTNLQGSEAGNYDVALSNVWGRATSAAALLSVNWAPPDSFNPGADGSVLSLALQADGKILVGGQFTSLGGQNRNNIGRLNPDGTPDLTFNPSGDNAGSGPSVTSMAVQPDGKVLVGGEQNFYLGFIDRFNADGSWDSFSPFRTLVVSCLALEADGKILVGTFGALLKLNADGTLDSSFDGPSNGGDSPAIYCLALQADGKILAGGSFTTLHMQTCTNIGRLNPNGSLDTSFNPEADGEVHCLVVQADGKILVGGGFTMLGGRSCTNLGRLNADGTLDTGFNPGADGEVDSLALQADGKILLGGQFSTLGGESRNYLARLNPDGTLDTSFNPATDSGVVSLALQADGKILVGGGFTTLAGQSRANIGRLNNTAPATQALTFDGSTLTWLRGGTSPEVWRTTFEYSPDGRSWASLGAGVRIPGGWELVGLALPTNSTFRARGFTVGGEDDGSCWFVETIAGSVVIDTTPGSLTNNAGTTAVFQVHAVGNGPLSYQWRKDGRNLADGGNVSGAAAATLTLSNVLGGDAGGYSVVISNAAGTVTSPVAALTVIDPVIIVQPVARAVNQGDAITFSVTAAGTPPLIYQWRKDGVIQAGATRSSLTLLNLQGLEAGNYDVVVSNVWGNVTSTAASFSVNLALTDSFNPGADNWVNTVAVQADGKIVVGGNFTALGGQSRTNFGRLNADGTLDTSFPFVSERLSDYVNTLAVEADGKIVVGGSFDTLSGQSHHNIGRLNADGTVDASFNPGEDGTVDSVALQPDGKILVAGLFTNLNTLNNIGRLNPDGTADASFHPGSDGEVNCVVVQGDGKILVGGHFLVLGGQSRTNIGRLNADGTLDTSFNPGADGYYGVSSLAVQADGKILVGGGFTTLGGQVYRGIRRLSADGSLDTSFGPGTDYIGTVFSLALQADGKILVGGQFFVLGGQSRTNIARLNADGTLDMSFNPGADGYHGVSSLAVQADGKILVAGGFGTLGGQSRNNIGRLNNTEPATQSLVFDGSDLTWMRGGTSPEVWRTTFEYSPDGNSWISLDPGIRIPGGWQLTGLGLAANTTFRARGYTVGGEYNGSSWFVETILRPALAISHPLYSSNGRFGFTLSGPAGQLVVVEFSTDLLNWVPIWTNTFSGPLHFTDPQSGVHASRFYRASFQ